MRPEAGNLGVVMHDDRAVAGGVDVELDAVGVQHDRPPEGGARVLVFVAGGAAVGDDAAGVAWPPKIAALNKPRQSTSMQPWMSASPVLETPSDHELAAAYRAGDERAAAELVRRHAPAVGRFLYSSGAAPDEIDDLVQEALFRAFRAAGRLAGRGVVPELALRDRGQRAAGRVPAPEGPAGGLARGSGLPDRADPAGRSRRDRSGGAAPPGDRERCRGSSGKCSSSAPSREPATSRSPPRSEPRPGRLGCTTTTRSSDSRSWSDDGVRTPVRPDARCGPRTGARGPPKRRPTWRAAPTAGPSGISSPPPSGLGAGAPRSRDPSAIDGAVLRRLAEDRPVPAGQALRGARGDRGRRRGGWE